MPTGNTKMPHWRERPPTLERGQNHSGYHRGSDEVGENIQDAHMGEHNAKTRVHRQHTDLQPYGTQTYAGVIYSAHHQDSNRRAQGSAKETARAIEIQHEKVDERPFQADRTLQINRQTEESHPAHHCI